MTEIPLRIGFGETNFRSGARETVVEEEETAIGDNNANNAEINETPGLPGSETPELPEPDEIPEYQPVLQQVEDMNDELKRMLSPEYQAQPT